MYSREEVKAITDKVLNMASKATAAEVDFTGGERSATRFARVGESMSTSSTSS